MTFPLATNILHRSAADSYRRAAQARRHAARYPHCAERELRSAAYWVESAEFWRAEAARDAGRIEPMWVLPTWQQELEHMLGCPLAIAAEVE